MLLMRCCQALIILNYLKFVTSCQGLDTHIFTYTKVKKPHLSGKLTREFNFNSQHSYKYKECREWTLPSYGRLCFKCREFLLQKK